jgi:nucleoside-diphosphate-sugar epimerase
MGWEHVLPQFVLRMKECLAGHGGGLLAFPIQGSGDETRAFVFIDDMIDGVRTMMDRGDHLAVYHIGSMEEVSIADTARLVGKYFGCDVQIEAGELLAGGTPRRCPDIAKLAALGYAPKIPLADGVPVLADWYDNHADLAP